MKQRRIKYLKDLLVYLEYTNRMSPFPIYDTEYVQVTKEQLEQMNDDNINYDELPTVACKHCNHLGIYPDEVENDICLRCGSVNEINIFTDYYAYERHINNTPDESN